MKKLDVEINYPNKEIKLAVMGGLTCDVFIRSICSGISAIVFGIFAFYYIYKWRIRRAKLKECYVLDGTDVPVDKSTPDATNISRWWWVVFVATFATQVSSLLQILTATIAYKTTRRGIFDHLLAPLFSVLNIIA